MPESTCVLIPRDKNIFEYLPIGTLQVDLEVGHAQARDKFWAASEHRKHLLTANNTHFLYSHEEAAQEKNQAWDAVLKALFQVSYTLNRVTFARETITPVHPSGDMSLKWTKENSDMKGVMVFIFAPAGRTLATLAQ